MADQSKKRQQFRFWYPFWENPATRPSLPRAPSSQTQTQPKTQPQPQSDQSQPNKRTSRILSFSPSTSKQKQKEATPTQSPSRRAPRNSPSSSPSPTPAQSPSRRSTQTDRGKEKIKDELPQPSSLSPSPSKSAQKPREISQEESPIKEMIELKEEEPKSQEQNLTGELTTPNVSNNKENDSSKLESLESKPLSFDPLFGVKPNETVISERNPIDDQQKSRENHEKTSSQPKEDLMSNEEISKPQLEERNEQINAETTRNVHPISLTATEQEYPKETIKEENTIETKEENLKEIIKSIDKTNQGENSKEKSKEIEKSSEETPHIEKPIRGENGSPATKKDERQLTSEYNLNSNEKIQNPIITNHNSNDKTENIIMNNNHKSVDESSSEKGEEKLSVENHNSNIKVGNNMAENYPRRKEKTIASSSQTRPSFQKDIKQGISKLIQNINTGNPHNPSSESGTFIITLAGENKGASMYIGHKDDHEKNSVFLGKGHKLNENQAESSNGNCKENEGENDDKSSEVSSNVNSNVQSINNSVMHGSSCDMRDPGVRFTLLNKVKNEKMKKKENETPKHLMKH